MYTPDILRNRRGSQDTQTERGAVGMVGGGRATTRGVTRGRPGDSSLTGAMQRLDIGGGGDHPRRRREILYEPKHTRPDSAANKKGLKCF